MLSLLRILEGPEYNIWNLPVTFLENLIFSWNSGKYEFSPIRERVSIISQNHVKLYDIFSELGKYHYFPIILGKYYIIPNILVPWVESWDKPEFWTFLGQQRDKRASFFQRMVHFSSAWDSPRTRYSRRWHGCIVSLHSPHSSILQCPSNKILNSVDSSSSSYSS